MLLNTTLSARSFAELGATWVRHRLSSEGETVKPVSVGGQYPTYRCRVAASLKYWATGTARRHSPMRDYRLLCHKDWSAADFCLNLDSQPAVLAHPSSGVRRGCIHFSRWGVVWHCPEIDWTSFLRNRLFLFIFRFWLILTMIEPSFWLVWQWLSLKVLS